MILQIPDGSWKVTVDRCKLNLVVALIEVAMMDVVTLLEQIEPQVLVYGHCFGICILSYFSKKRGSGRVFAHFKCVINTCKFFC